jgi:hypothetical protein
VIYFAVFIKEFFYVSFSARQIEDGLRVWIGGTPLCGSDGGAAMVGRPFPVQLPTPPGSNWSRVKT